MIDDAADAVKSFIAKAESLDHLENLNLELATIQTNLNDFLKYLARLPTPAARQPERIEPGVTGG